MCWEKAGTHEASTDAFRSSLGIKKRIERNQHHRQTNIVRTVDLLVDLAV